MSSLTPSLGSLQVRSKADSEPLTGVAMPPSPIACLTVVIFRIKCTKEVACMSNRYLWHLHSDSSSLNDCIGSCFVLHNSISEQNGFRCWERNHDKPTLWYLNKCAVAACLHSEDTQTICGHRGGVTCSRSRCPACVLCTDGENAF